MPTIKNSIIKKISKNIPEKRKILIDLDVVTVGKWDKGLYGDNSRKLMSRVRNKEFYIITPTLLLDLVRQWRHEKLKVKIEDFYLTNSNELLERIQIIEEIVSKGIDFEELFNILVSTLRDTLLITFNRIHLKNKEEEINGILSEYSLRAIKIASPGQF